MMFLVKQPTQEHTMLQAYALTHLTSTRLHVQHHVTQLRALPRKLVVRGALWLLKQPEIHAALDAVAQDAANDVAGSFEAMLDDRRVDADDVRGLERYVERCVERCIEDTPREMDACDVNGLEDSVNECIENALPDAITEAMEEHAEALADRVISVVVEKLRSA